MNSKIVREIKKLRNNEARKELIQYIHSPNIHNVLVLISEDYDLRNSYLKKIADLSEMMDFRPPFEDAMRKWLRYILKTKNIEVTESALQQYIHLYGDSIAHVINEIEKTVLALGEGKEINDENINAEYGIDRVYNLWNLQDSLGKKDLQSSISIANSFFANGIKITGILISLVCFYQQMLWKKMGRNYPVGYSGINKIITSRLNQYDQLYTNAELVVILGDLLKLDLLSKSTSIKDNFLLHPFIVKICKV